MTAALALIAGTACTAWATINLPGLPLWAVLIAWAAFCTLVLGAIEWVEQS